MIDESSPLRRFAIRHCEQQTHAVEPCNDVHSERNHMGTPCPHALPSAVGPPSIPCLQSMQVSASGSGPGDQRLVDSSFICIGNVPILSRSIVLPRSTESSKRGSAGRNAMAKGMQEQMTILDKQLSDTVDTQSIAMLTSIPQTTWGAAGRRRPTVTGT